METAGDRQPGGGPLPQDPHRGQRHRQQGHPQHDDQHPPRVLRHYIDSENGVGGRQETDPSHILLRQGRVLIRKAGVEGQEEINNNSNRQHKLKNQYDNNATSKQRSGERREKSYIPRIMPETILVDTANSTSLHFDLNHKCRKHNVLIIIEQVERCEEISGCINIRRYARRLKEQNIRDWEMSERKQAIAEIAALAGR